MNYQRIYDQLVEKRQTDLWESLGENHHIIPTCLGGLNDVSNLVKFSYREHFIAHQLLVKIHPENRKLINAANMMMYCNGHKFNARRHSWVKERWKAAVPKKQRPEVGRKISAAMKGKVQTLEHRQKNSAANSGPNNAMFGKTHSNEARAKISNAHKGRKLSVEICAKMSAARKGIPKTTEHNAKNAAAHLGKKRSPETCAKISAGMKGRVAWNKGLTKNEYPNAGKI